MARVVTSVSVSRAEEDVSDGLEVGVVAVLVLPDGKGDAAETGDLKHRVVKLGQE